MKENYQLLLEKEIQSLDSKKNLLLHCCCAICSSYVIDYLHNYFNITVLFYNPNIFPEEEYLKRKDTLLKLLKNYNDVKIIDIDYDETSFYNRIVGLENEKEGGKRCSVCINLRLEKTAIIAKEKNFDYFATTLTISPHKNSTMINNLGVILQNKYNIKWLYGDFKKKEGFKKAITLSNKYNLYRQNYCGCKYSIYE